MATVGRSLPDEPSVWSAIREVGERGAGQVVVTAGAKPTMAWDGKQGWRLAPPSIKALNPIGSGDAFTAGLVLRLVRGMAWERRAVGEQRQARPMR